jgi:hypothetical protein
MPFFTLSLKTSAQQVKDHERQKSASTAPRLQVFATSALFLKLASYQFYVLKKKKSQHENLQTCTIAIHLIAISPTRRCFPFLFMFSFSFPAI